MLIDSPVPWSVVGGLGLGLLTLVAGVFGVYAFLRFHRMGQQTMTMLQTINQLLTDIHRLVNSAASEQRILNADQQREIVRLRQDLWESALLQGHPPSTPSVEPLPANPPAPPATGREDLQ